ncbi:hypothetical protein E4U19_003003 [Claviceps sp. Clav32 group G5]|nr:hypothetical protein E4U19_003003 [Claviceps sp. Clav32 group G5]
MHFRLFRSSNRDKRSAGPEEHRAGYDDYGMSNDKQWARKYLLDPLTAPEPNQEWPSSLQSQSETQPQWRSASSSPPPANHDNHRGDMRDALQKVNRRLLDIKQRYRRSSSSSNTLTQSPRGYPRDYPRDYLTNTTNTDDRYACASTNCRNTLYRSSSHKNISNRNPSYRNVSYRNTNHRSTNPNSGSHTSSYPRDARYSISPSCGSSHRHSHSPAIRTEEFDPTNPYYRTSTSSSSSCPRDSARSSPSNYGPRRQSRQSASSSSNSSYYTRSSSYSRRRSSADTALTSSPPSLYSGHHGGSFDLGPYPAHLTNPRLQKPVQRRGSPGPAVRVPAAAAALSWEGRSCEQLKKARLLSLQHV